MTSNFEFEPSAGRARALDVRMRERLADSLSYVAEELGEELSGGAAMAERALPLIRSRRVSSLVFGAYYDLVLAASEDDREAAATLAAEIACATPLEGEVRVVELDDPSAGLSWGRFRRLMDTDPETPLALYPPRPDVAAECRRRVAEAFELLDRGFPAMAAEIRGLIGELVLAAGDDNPKALTFDGASCFMLWGAVLLNVKGQSTVLDTAQALAHESGHNLLFGFCTHGWLVENEDEERFASPLRADPRPMDGIVHATYVTARMHQTVSRLLQARVLDPAQTEAALKDQAAHAAGFHSGDEVIRRSGRLTSLGASVMDSARSYMAQHAAPVPA